MQTDTSKTIVITGASRGIGLEVCRQAMAAGHNVIGLSRNTAPLEKAGVRAFAIDLADPSSLDVFFEYVRSSELVIDGLINNAGLLQNVPFNQSSWDIFESVYRVNVFGLSEMIRLSLPFVSSLGHIVNISSMGGIQGSSKFPGLAAYSSSKGAVITLTELLAEEYKASGPSFNALALGAVQTEMLEAAFPGYEAPTTAKQMGTYILDFTLNGHQFYNGKVLPVANSTP